MDILSNEDILKLSPEDQTNYLEVLKQYEEIKKYNLLSFFEPYEFQKKFYELGATETVRALICANRSGKSYSAAMEIAMHTTGIYPDWWQGRRWDKPVAVACAGVTTAQVKRVIQKELIGTENREFTDKIGTGAIPKANIDMEKSAKSRDGGLSEIAIKHSSGGYSNVILFAYSQGMLPMQGFTVDLVWIDEQDKHNFDVVFSELVKRTASSEGSTIATFTPLQGLTHVVRQFWEPSGALHGGLVNAGWDDVKHLSENAKNTMLATTPPHLRDAVTKGIPVLGAGAVFNIGEHDIIYDDIEVADDWPRLCGIDVGFTTDPTAGIFVAKEPSTGIYYIYDEYGTSDNNTWNASQHVGHLHAKNCGSIPIIYDSAAKARVGATGKAITELWQEMGLNVLPESFKNPSWMSEKVSSYKDISVGLVRMFELMATGQLKVHRKCENWWREFRSYSYDDKGVPSSSDNHWMDASRYAIMTAERGQMQVIGNDWFNSDHDDYYFQTY